MRWKNQSRVRRVSHNDETLGQIAHREQLFVSLLLDLAAMAGDNAEELMTRL